ncbi:PQQ-binding-like beta-propeller repeat protein [Phenylobacterium sp.]|uniref:YncE family protein n=1 Tax=Phenylobacterium sp. TaxID=1871053 RepID=UPI00286A1AF4|nr:PQQ-binding-like beta-propeller repeat protein [Phenylobacterium sp.]
MTIRSILLLTCATLALGACGKSQTAAAAPTAPAPAPLTLAGSVDLPGYKGDFDHFAVDEKDNRLFLAGEESAELEVFDLTTGALEKRLTGYGVPHSLHLTPATGELLVVDGGKPSQVLDAKTLMEKRTIKLPAGADSADFDSSNGHLWIVTGGKDVPLPDSHLSEIDPATGKVFHDVRFDADHVEALAVQQAGPKLFINVTDKNYLAVIDKTSGKVVDKWKIKEAEQNAPVAMDEKNHRLFVVTRKPGKLVVINADTGATVASFKAPERTDQVTWDPDNRRVYVTGGEGYISVVQQDDADHYREIAKIPSLPGAKTAILAPSVHRLYVAASPGESGAMGKVMWYTIAPRG